MVATALAVAMVAFAVPYTIARGIRTIDAPTQVIVDASPIPSFDNRDPTRVRFGALEFRGGLVLTAKPQAFGGISAIEMSPDGERLLAVTDRGSWLRARIRYDNGRIAGIGDVEMAPILGPDGKPLAEREWFDTESLTQLNGQFYVGIERVEKIVRFDIAREGLQARGHPVEVPSDFKSLTRNKSLECLAGVPQGAPLAGNLIAVTERSLDDAGNFRSYLLKGKDVGRFSVKRNEDFEISDCTILPPGDLLLLERSYSPLRGVGMRIRRVPLSSIKPGTTVDGPLLIEADLGYQIDNMEGITVHRTAAGETVITLVSDDNFSVLQRTLLLQFTLVGN